MYKINYVTTVIKQNKSEVIFIKLLKILNLLIQLAIIAIVLQIFNLYNQTEICDSNIEKMKTIIAEKRASNYMNNIERDWTMNYYKLQAVRQMLSNRTAYGLLLKSFAEAIPETLHVSDISIKNNSLCFNLELTKEKKRQYADNIYKYVEEVKTVFDKKDFFNKDNIELINTKEQKINDNIVDLAEIKIECKTRK